MNIVCPRWHRLGERCECGHVTIPARFYWIGDKEQTHAKAEERYLEFLKGSGLKLRTNAEA